MAKNDAPVEQAKDESPAVKPVVETITVSLNEYCTRLSEKVIRPELIGAFASTERAAGKVSDTPENFQARYNSFINKPV